MLNEVFLGNNQGTYRAVRRVAECPLCNPKLYKTGLSYQGNGAGEAIEDMGNKNENETKNEKIQEDLRR